MRGVVMMNASPSGLARSDRDIWRAVGPVTRLVFVSSLLLYSGMVYNYCFGRTASWSSAEDAVQPTFATLWRRAVSGKVDEQRLASARPMLLAIARGTGRLAQDDERLIYRVARECLRNAVSTPGASHIGLTLASGDGLVVVEVTENGTGFDPQKKLGGCCWRLEVPSR
jgi:hypothetical protein